MKLRLVRELEQITYTHDERVEKNRNAGYISFAGLLIIFVFSLSFISEDTLSYETKFNWVKNFAMFMIPFQTLFNCATDSLYNSRSDKFFLGYTILFCGLSAAFHITINYPRYRDLIPNDTLRGIFPILVLVSIPLFFWLSYRCIIALILTERKRLLQHEDENKQEN